MTSTRAKITRFPSPGQLNYIIYLFGSVGDYTTTSMWRSENNFWGFLSSILWVPGIRLGLSGLLSHFSDDTPHPRQSQTSYLRKIFPALFFVKDGEADHDEEGLTQMKMYIGGAGEVVQLVEYKELSLDPLQTCKSRPASYTCNSSARAAETALRLAD